MMMAGGGAGERDDGRPEGRSLNTFVLAKTYNLMAVTGLGYLAFTWSTVVLLGGFVTALQRKDFWAITVISMIQAARIFDDLTDHLFPNYVLLMLALALLVPIMVLLLILSFLYAYGPLTCIALSIWRLRQHDYAATGDGDDDANLEPALDIYYSLVLCQGALIVLWYVTNSMWPMFVNSLRRECELPKDWGLTSIRMYLLDTEARCERDPTSMDRRKLVHYAVDLLDSDAWEDNLSGAKMLDVFIRQGAGIAVRALLLPSRPKVQKLLDMLGWRRGPPQDQGGNRDLREAAARVVANLAGDIHLAHFPGAIRSVSSLLSLSGGRSITHHTRISHEPIQTTNTPVLKVVELLLLRLERKIREVHFRFQHASFKGVATSASGDGGSGGTELILQGLTILERLASDHQNCQDICTTPGLLPKILAPLYSDTLLQDLRAAAGGAWPNVVSASFRVVHQLIQAPGFAGRRLRLEISSHGHAVSNLERIVIPHHQGQGGDGAGGQELQVRATESIVIHHHQCQGGDEAGGQKLQMRATEMIVIPHHQGQGGDEAGGQELQTRATEILTQLALDLSLTNPSGEAKRRLIGKQLHIFLAHEEAGDQQQAANPLKATAGRTLVRLSSDSQTHCDFIMRAYDDDGTKTLPHPTEITEAKKNMVDRLTELLQANNNITYRTRAAQILKNLCTHCALDKQVVKQALLPKILAEMPFCKTKPRQHKNRTRGGIGLMALMLSSYNEEPQKNPAPGNDEENQQNPSAANGANITTRGHDNTKIQKTSPQAQQNKSSDQGDEAETDSKKELQEAFLSLTLLIFDKMITADDFDDAVLKGAIGQCGFGEKLLTMVEGNREATAVSLRIVKLCGQIYVSLMQRKAPLHHFKHREFVESLSEALGTMSDLESSLLFAATDLGLNEAVRPLLSSVLKQAQELVPSVVDGGK